MKLPRVCFLSDNLFMCWVYSQAVHKMTVHKIWGLLKCHSSVGACANGKCRPFPRKARIRLNFKEQALQGTEVRPEEGRIAGHSAKGLSFRASDAGSPEKPICVRFWPTTPPPPASPGGRGYAGSPLPWRPVKFGLAPRTLSVHIPNRLPWRSLLLSFRRPHFLTYFFNST